MMPVTILRLRIALKMKAAIGLSTIGAEGKNPCLRPVQWIQVDAIYSYDAYDRLMRVVDEFGTREFTYEQDTVRDYRWRVTMTATSGEAAYTWVMIYNYAGDLLEWTDDNGFTRTYTYDLVGRMTSVSTNDSTDAAFIDVTYNRIGQVTRIEDGREAATVYEYEQETGRLLRQTESFGDDNLSSTIYQYSESGLLESVVVCQGDEVDCTEGSDVEKIEYGYDTNDPTLLTSVTINGDEHQFSWEGTNTNIRDNQLRYTNPLDNDTVYRFNVLGQLMQATDAEGNAYEWTYNNFGYLAGYELPDLPLLIKSDDSSQQTQSSRFTPQYQLAYNSIFDADNDVRFFAVGDSALAWRRTIQRTPMGLPLSFENPGVLRFGYDALARLSSVSSYAQSGSLETGWQMVQRDGQNSMQFSIAGVETLPSYTLLFDPLNRLVGLGDETATQDYDFSSPPGSEETITIPGEEASVRYTITENRVTVARSGEEWRYSYDVLGRLQQVEFARCEQSDDDDPGCPGESDTRITYDAAGNVTEMVHEDGTHERFKYDDFGMGNLETYTLDQNGESHTYIYRYDDANRLIAIDSPDDRRMTYFYVGERIAGMCVSSPSEPQGECADDSIIERYSYDALGRITARQFLTYAGPSMGDVVNDFRTDIEDNTAGNMYETSPQTLYTPLGQLATVGNGAALDYDDDGLGLLTTYEAGGTTYSFTYEPNIRFDPARPILLTGITNSEVPFANYTYTYDAWGRVKEFTVNGRSFQYAYEVNDFSVSDGSSSVRVPYTGVAVEPSTRCEVDDSQDTSSDRCIMRDSSFTVERRFTTEAWTNFEHPGLPLVSQIIDLERVSDPRVEAGEDPWRNFNSGEPIEYSKHRYFYDYDEVGNLTGIVYFGPYSVYPVNDADAVFVPIQCAAFTYDNANRLMSAQVRQPAGTIDWADLDQHGLDWLSDQPAFGQRALLTDENAVTYHYQYDAYDRLVQAGDYSFIYVNDSLVPSFIYQGDRLVTATPSANADGWGFDGWVFDDTGWLVPVGGFEGDTENPCSLGLPTEQPEFEMGTVLFDGMLVDPASGLYFYGGRAYLPSIGRFLQRDPLGPDVAGNVYGYEYPSRAVEIPMPEQRSTIGDGLHVLSYAMMWYPERQMMTADTILKQNLPHIEPTLNGFSRTLLQQQRNADGMIRSYLEMPVRIRDSFNQPSPQIDLASGLVSWQPNMVPWQAAPNGESLFANEFWENEIALNSPILTPDAMFSRLNTLTTVGYRPPTTAAPQGWNQSQTVSIPGNDLPVSPFVQSPDAVLNPLLPSWTDPTSSLYVLDVTEGMRQQPYQTGLLWAQEALEMQLPAIYILPIVPDLYKPDVQFSPTHVTP